MKHCLLSTPVLFLEVVCFLLVFLCHVLLQLLSLVPLWVDPVSQEILPKKRAWSVTTILLTNQWNRHRFSWIFSKISYSLFTLLFSLKCAPPLPQCWATHILGHWDDCNTQIKIGEGETHNVFQDFWQVLQIFSCCELLKAEDTGFNKLKHSLIHNYKHCWGVIAKIKSIFISYSHSSAFNMFNGPFQRTCTMYHDTLFKSWWTKAATLRINKINIEPCEIQSYIHHFI